MREDRVCFDIHTLRGWLTLLMIIVVFMCWIAVTKRKAQVKESFTKTDLESHLSQGELIGKVQLLQEQLHSCQTKNTWCEMELSKATTQCNNNNTSLSCAPVQCTDKLIPPERIYVSPKAFSVPQQFQNVGFVHGNDLRYPLYGRYREPGRSDRWEYYIVDEGRNRLKIPFKTKNWTELYDNDMVIIPTIGEMKVSLYDFQTFRYNPNPDLLNVKGY